MKDLVNDENLLCESLYFYKRVEPVFQEINNYMTKPNSNKVNNIFREKRYSKSATEEKQWLNAAINKAIFDILNLPFFDFAIENQLKHALIRLTTRLDVV